MAKTTLVGHAELLHCLAEWGPQALAEVASFFHLKYDPPPAAAVPDEKLSLEEPAEMPPAPMIANPAAELRPLAFWRVKHWEELVQDAEVPEWYQQAEPLDEFSDLEPARQPAPLPRPLQAWSRLGPTLRRACGQQLPDGRLDLPRLVATLARAQTPLTLPRTCQLRWAPRLWVLVDRRRELAPFWSDYAQLLRRLRAHRGCSGLRVHVLDEGCRDLGLPSAPAVRHSLPGPGELGAVLVLGDLGHYARCSASQQCWQAWGHHWTQQGHRCTALLPCPQRLRTPSPNLNWQVLTWDRGIGERSGDEAQVAKGLTALLALLAPAVFVEPALLRAVRLMLPAAMADVGSEWQFWQHESLRDGVTAVAWAEGEQEWRRERFTAWLETTAGREQAARALALIQAYHQPYSCFVREEEQLQGLAWLNEAVPVSEIMARVAKTLDSGTACDELRAWARRWLVRQSKDMFYDDRLAAVAYAALADEPISGVVITPPSWQLRDRLPRELVLRHCGETLNQDEGPPLLRVCARTDHLHWDGQRFSLENLALPLRAERPGEVELETDLGRWTLERCQRPSWARRIGRDQRHLFCEVDGRVLIWLDPCDLAVEGQAKPLRLTQGRWIDQSLGERWLREGIRTPAGADALGLDQQGVYADFSLETVSWRMRLILPGSFLMGSPADEPERFDDEQQHPVTLSRGCWLGETTVTQALWWVVAGINPSHFKGEQLPVEWVSWDDIQSFLSRLNMRKPGLALRLPTEAEWEYACRAGTATPFHFGVQISTEQANYHGHYPYKGGPVGEYRGRTVEVKALPANDWGLYQMHGNVWEWCMDWEGAYTGAAVDPLGPQAGARRVLRGGSWDYFGGNARAAVRDAYGPGDRDRDCGFRLARGQDL